MATIYNGGNVDLLSGKVAVLGFGSQGHAHALNLHDSGVEVEVGLRGQPLPRGGRSAGLTVSTVAEAVEGAQLVAILLPDQVQTGVYEDDVAPNLAYGAALLFAHGFNILYERIQPPRRQRRDHGGAEGAGPHRSQALHRGARNPGADRGRARRSGQALELALAYRYRDRLRPRRHARDDVRGGDGDRPLRRAVGAVRRGQRADQSRVRDARRSGLPAGDRLLRVSPRAEADRGPDLGGRPLAHALLDLRHGRVR